MNAYVLLNLLSELGARGGGEIRCEALIGFTNEL